MIVDNFLNIFDFFSLEIQKGFFDFKDFSSDSGWLRYLSIWISLSFIV